MGARLQDAWTFVGRWPGQILGRQVEPNPCSPIPSSSFSSPSWIIYMAFICLYECWATAAEFHFDFGRVLLSVTLFLCYRVILRTAPRFVKYNLMRLMQKHEEFLGKVLGATSCPQSLIRLNPSTESVFDWYVLLADVSMAEASG